MGRAYARKFPRLSVSVVVDYATGEECFRGAAKTLSGGGLFLTRTDGLEAGKEMVLRFRPARHLPFINAKGRVLYVLPGKGAAVAFTEITAEDRHTLLRLIHQKTGDRRLQPRAPLATQVQCDQCMSLAFSRDISLGGMFIETNNLLPVGSAITVRFNLDQRDTVVTATAQVAYHVEKMGMGVLFTEIDPEDCDAIQKYVESLPALPETPPQKRKTA